MGSAAGRLVIVQLKAHAIVDLVILQCDVVLEDVVPLLDADLLRACARLSCHQLLQVADRVILAANQVFDHSYTAIALKKFVTLTVAEDLQVRMEEAARRDGEGKGGGRGDEMNRGRTHLHFTRIFLPSRSFKITSIIVAPREYLSVQFSF